MSEHFNINSVLSSTSKQVGNVEKDLKSEKIVKKRESESVGKKSETSFKHIKQQYSPRKEE